MSSNLMKFSSIFLDERIIFQSGFFSTLFFTTKPIDFTFRFLAGIGVGHHSIICDNPFAYFTLR